MISVGYSNLGRGYSENNEGWLWHGSDGKLLASHHEGPGSIPGQFMLNLCWIKCNLDSFHTKQVVNLTYSKPCSWIRGLTHISKRKNKSLTVLTGKRGSDVAEGEEGVGGFSSLLAMACCNCSNFGPRRYLSRHNLTFCPVLLSTSTAWWFV